MPVPGSFFEFRDQRPMDGRPWIVLREVSEAPLEPPEADVVRLEEWSGTGSAAVDAAHRTEAEEVGWSDGLGVQPHRVAVEEWGYSSADVFRSWREPLGINLVIDQHVELGDLSIWHLHPDLVVALGLVQERDSWFRPEEGWVEVVRLRRDADGRPSRLEIRSEFLRDYLAACGMALYCSTYRERVMVTASRPALGWPDDGFSEASGRDRREGIVTEADYPDPDGHFWTRGALWRTEWVESGGTSTRVRGDDDPHVSTFALKADGSRAAAAELTGAMAWLHFAPTLVPALLRHRGARLRWYSRETGGVGATGRGVHFGMNDLGHVTVFAKDVAALPPWEQRVWSAHNVTPEGGVSRELFAAQMEVSPAATVAPEKELPGVIDALDEAFRAKHGRALLREHASVPAMLARAHRFLAAEPDGVLELSKELTRLFMERVDVDAVVAVVGLRKGESRLGSLKALEGLVATNRSPEFAAAVMAPLFGIYDLRLADAHLGSGKVASGMERAGVVEGDPGATQGRQLLQGFVEAVGRVTEALRGPAAAEPGQA